MSFSTKYPKTLENPHRSPGASTLPAAAAAVLVASGEPGLGCREQDLRV